MLTINCFTWNDIDSTVVACFEKSRNSLHTSIINIGEHRQAQL